MNETITVELTRAETLFLELILGDERKDCTNRYDSFLAENDKVNGLKYPENAEDSFLRILGRIDMIREKLTAGKVK